MSDYAPASLDYLAILFCPHSGNDLSELSSQELEEINHDIAQGQFFHFEGSPVAQSLSRGLISSCGKYVYRMEKGVIILLKNLALVRESELQPEEAREGLMKDKKDVQDFYNQFGWNKTDEGHFHDADEFEDLRDVSQQYLHDCNMRVKRYLRPSGEYLLDAASGPIQYDDYLAYNQDYKYRVCIDLSFWPCARPGKSWRPGYLPGSRYYPDAHQGRHHGCRCFLNTIYHITKDEQAQAFRELHRVLKPEASGVVVYSWGRRSHLNNFLALPHKVVRKLKAMVRTSMPQKEGALPELYFHAHPRSYFTRERLGFDMDLVVWRILSVPVMKYYIHNWLGGKSLLKAIYRYEDKNPEWCGKVGEYPMFYLKKSNHQAKPSK